MPATVKAKKDVFVLFWVYGDGEDVPYIIRNPPKNLGKLLKEWNKLDDTADDQQPGAEGWDYVNVWLKKKGVDIIEAKKEVRLDDHR